MGAGVCHEDSLGLHDHGLMSPTVAGTVTDASGHATPWSASWTVAAPVTSFPVGVSHGSGNWGGLTGWPAHRFYNGAATAPWPATLMGDQDMQIAVNDGARLVVFSWKNKPTTSQLNAFCSSLSAVPTNVQVALAYFHEMEDNLTGTVFLNEFSRQRAIIQAHATVQARGVKFGPIYQAWTFNPQSGRDWHDWWDPASDFLGVEAYNPGRKKTPPEFDPPADFLDRVFTALAEAGKPTIAPEFGMPVHPTDPSIRPAYIQSIVNYYRTKCPVPVLGMCYWDSVVSNDNRLDPAAAQALMAMNI